MTVDNLKIETNCVFRSKDRVTLSPETTNKLAASFFKAELILGKYINPQIKTLSEFEDLMAEFVKNEQLDKASFYSEKFIKDTSVISVIDRAYRIANRVENNLRPSMSSMRNAIKEDASLVLMDVDPHPYLHFVGHMYKSGYYLIYNTSFI